MTTTVTAADVRAVRPVVVSDNAQEGDVVHWGVTRLTARMYDMEDREFPPSLWWCEDL